MLLIAVLVASPLCAGELEERQRVRLAVSELFLSEKLAELEALAARYRSTEERTLAGASKLRLFYEGIEEAMPESPTDGDSWKRQHQIAQKWIDAYHRSPTPYVAKAHIFINRAWAFRGGGFANTVSAWNSLRYKQEAKKARDWLLEHSDIASQDPDYYAVLSFAYRAKPKAKDEVRALIYEGISRFANYDHLYFRGAGYLSPKWSGSLQELAKFATHAVDRTGDERGHEMYARVYWAAGSSGNGRYYFQEPNTDIEKLEQGMRDLVQNYPDQWNVNHMALYACVLNNRDLAADFIDLIEPPIIEQAWLTERNYNGCLRWLGRNSE